MNTLVALSVLVGYSITTASFVTYIVKEYDNGSKRLQHIAGVGEVLYWITSFLYDLVNVQFIVCSEIIKCIQLCMYHIITSQEQENKEIRLNPDLEPTNLSPRLVTLLY